MINFNPQLNHYVFYNFNLGYFIVIEFLIY